MLNREQIKRLGIKSRMRFNADALRSIILRVREMHPV